MISESSNTPVKSSTGKEEYLQFEVTPITAPTEPGTLGWNSIDGTMDVHLYNDTVLQMGQETHFYGKAVGAIANGELCQFAGVQGDHITIKKAVAADIIATPHYCVGVATQNIANGTFGYTTWFGKVNNVYTKTPANNDSADWLAGDILYFDNTTGQLTKTAPNAPKVRIIIAAVIKEQTGASETGIIIVRPSFGIRVQDCDDVDGGTLSKDGQFYVWDNTNQYFVPTQKVIINDTTPTIYSEGNGGTATDLHIACGTDKTIVLDETVWDDIQFQIATGKVPAVNFPTWETFTTNTSEYSFAVNDYIALGANEMAHWWKEGTSAAMHIHVTTKAANTSGADRFAKFTIYIAYADVNAVWTETSLSAELTIANGTAALTHKLLSMGTLTLTGIKIGTQVKITVKRIAATGGTEYASNIFITQVGAHAEKDTMGSRSIGTK